MEDEIKLFFNRVAQIPCQESKEPNNLSWQATENKWFYIYRYETMERMQITWLDRHYVSFSNNIIIKWYYLKLAQIKYKDLKVKLHQQFFNLDTR